jgi:hypothetical protein
MSTSTNIPEADLRALRGVLSRLPYTGSMGRTPYNIGSVAEAVEYLEAAVQVQQEAAERATRTEEAHWALQRDLAAVRRVFGISQA